MIKKIVDSFRLKNEREDFDTIHYTMERGIVFRGTNLWVLIFAIFIASVGLNINSTAVIIGAMLVSPLMGPILGMGYSLATYDFTLFRKSVSNYLFAIGAGLVTSTIYFFLSPFNEAHSELLARIRPNIYDVLVALFGGLAGILAISSKNKGNVVAGVAIATALMPPLCTAGYGLGTGKWNFFFGAFYLLTINTVFIALATLLTTRFLKFPIVPQINERHKVVANRWVTVIVLLTIIPSLYFGYLLVQQEKFTRSANEFIRNETLIEGDYLLKSEIKPLQKEIHLIYGGRAITEEEKKVIESRTKTYKLDNVKLVFGLGFSTNDLNEI